MNINEFVRERKGEWDRLESISGKVGASKASRLESDELWELGKLYTAAVSDLAVLKSSPIGSDPDNEVIVYLNSLVARVHGMIYRKPRFRLASAGMFFVKGFPIALRSALPYIAAATAVFAFSAVAGFVLGLDEPGFIELVVPDSIIKQVEKGRVWFKDLYAVAPQASSLLMTHNVSVTFLMVAAGITFGVGTVYLLALNGVLLGTVAALCFKHDLSLEFWAFVLPHGSLELSAVVIAAAAGMVLGHALIEPGPYTRAEFLSVRGQLAARLALGCVPLLVVAGLIEAFLSPSPLSAELKILFAAALFALLVAFLAFSGKEDQAGTSGLHIPESRSERLKRG